MSEELTVAVIGAGQIAGGYDEKKINNDDGTYSHAASYKAHGGFSLKTVFDIDRERAMEYKGYWGVASVAGSLSDIYTNFHHVVSVCTPDLSHYEIVKSLLLSRCCRTVFSEKPIALKLEQIEEIDRLSRETGINVVVNFQRHAEPAHENLCRTIMSDPASVVAVNVYYIKGLDHIGTTVIDTLAYFFGYPRAVYAYNRVYNKQVDGFTYEFILFYDLFNITVKTVDSERFVYNYHIYETDILFKDKRVTIEDNSRMIKRKGLTSFAYSGVAVLNDREPKYEETEFKFSMLHSIGYIYDITNGKAGHTVNTVSDSYNNKLVVDKIIESFETNKRIEIGDAEWKK